jgi:hypothetical protein
MCRRDYYEYELASSAFPVSEIWAKDVNASD